MTREGFAERAGAPASGPEVLHNAITGMKLRVVQSGRETGGQLLEFEATYPPHSAKPPEHFHPHQDEEFLILAGSMVAVVAGQQSELRIGSVLRIPAGTPHAMWNDDEEPAVAVWRTTPALGTEEFFRDVYRLAAEGRTDEHGTPGLLDVAWLFPLYHNEIRITRPPQLIQRILFGLLRVFVHSRRFRGRP